MPIAVLYKVAALLHFTQQFRRKQRVAASALQQCAAKILAEIVGFCVQQGIDKLSCLRLARVIERNNEVAVIAFQLGDNR